jgi:hypothetical protein
VVEGEGLTHAPGVPSYRGFQVLVTNPSGQPVSGAAVRFELPATGPTGTFPGGARFEEQITDAAGKASTWGIHWGQTTGLVRVMITAQAQGRSAGIVASVRLGSKPAAAPAPAPVPKASFEVPPPAVTAVHKPQSERVVESVPPPAAATTPLTIASFEVPIGEAPKAVRPSPLVAESSNAVDRPAGVIFTRNANAIHDIPTASSGRRKWVVIGLGIAGAVGGGFAYQRLNQRTPAAAAAVTQPPGPVLTLSPPSITVGAP